MEFKPFLFHPGLPLKSIPLSAAPVFPQTLVGAPHTPELFCFVSADPDKNCKAQAKLQALRAQTLPTAARAGRQYLLGEHSKTGLTSGGLPKCCDRTTKLIRVSGWPLSCKQEQPFDPIYLHSNKQYQPAEFCKNQLCPTYSSLHWKGRVEAKGGSESNHRSHIYQCVAMFMKFNSEGHTALLCDSQRANVPGKTRSTLSSAS